MFIACSRALALLVGVGALTLTCAGAPEARAQSSQPLVRQLAGVESEVIQSYMGKSSPSSPRYYSGGQWYAPEGPECWNCYDAAGTAAAVLSVGGVGGTEYRNVAIDTTNAAIAHRQRADGSFEGSASANAPITTAFYSVDLGITYLELREALDPATRSRWAAALAAAANYLIGSGQATWYINGNMNLREAEVMWLAWQATGNVYFEQQYEQEWQFTLTPPAGRWPGYGLQLTVTPKRADGADGAGYLAESGGGLPGFDPEYSMAQLDIATQMYVLTREARWLRLMNLLYNQLRPLVEITPPPRSAWDLNATGGSRKSEKIPFSTAALYVLAASGDRPGLTSEVGAQLTSTENEFRGAMQFTNATLYKDLSGELATPLLDAQWPSGIGVGPATALEIPEAEACSTCPTPGSAGPAAGSKSSSSVSVLSITSSTPRSPAGTSSAPRHLSPTHAHTTQCRTSRTAASRGTRHGQHGATGSATGSGRPPRSCIAARLRHSYERQKSLRRR